MPQNNHPQTKFYDYYELYERKDREGVSHVVGIYLYIHELYYKEVKPPNIMTVYKDGEVWHTTHAPQPYNDKRQPNYLIDYVDTGK